MLARADGRLYLGGCRDGDPVHFPYRVTSLLCCDMGFEFRDLVRPDENRLPFFQTPADKECGGETFEFSYPFSAEILDHKSYASFVLRHGLRIESLDVLTLFRWNKLCTVGSRLKFQQTVRPQGREFIPQTERERTVLIQDELLFQGDTQ